MRFHLLALPNAPTTKAYSLDGFAQCTIRFAQILKELGHYVVLYGSEENEAPCDEFVQCISGEDRKFLLKDTEYQHAAIDERWPLWQMTNVKMALEVAKRKQPRDFLCLIGGASQSYVANSHPELMCVEYSIGYTGSFSKYRVYESHAWRHYSMGKQNYEDGSFYDAVIPCFFDPAEFTYRPYAEDYYVYCGRFVNRKGVQIACDAAKAAGVTLKLVGHGTEFKPDYGEILGALPMHQRNDVISRARAVFTPTTYVEPFCCVAVEAQLCGTPVISTDFGGFTETVEHGKTGFRCNYLGEFVRAIEDVKKLDRKYIRDRAVRNYSFEAVKPQYQAYFQRLYDLWDKGWKTL